LSQPDGSFNPDRIARVATDDQIKMVELKVSQAPSPGMGGVPAAKVRKNFQDQGRPDGRGLHLAGNASGIFDAAEMNGLVDNMRKLSGGQARRFQDVHRPSWEFWRSARRCFRPKSIRFHCRRWQ